MPYVVLMPISRQDFARWCAGLGILMGATALGFVGALTLAFREA